MTSTRHRALLAFMLGLLLLATAIGVWQAAQAPRAGAHDSGNASQLELAPGEEIVLADGTRVRFLGIVSDSRCPMDAMCIHNGEVVVAFAIETADGYHENVEMTFEGLPVSKTVRGYDIRVTDVQPYPMASQPVDPDDYRVDVSVDAAG